MDDRDIGRSPEPPDEREEKKYFEIEEKQLAGYLWSAISAYVKGGDKTFAGRHRAINLTMKLIDYNEPYIHR